MMIAGCFAPKLAFRARWIAAPYAATVERSRGRRHAEPPPSLRTEFQRDREASWNQPVRGPEPVGGWEFYWSRLPEYPEALKSARLEGRVVVEGRIGTNGFASDLRVVSKVHPALAGAAIEAVQAERWEPAWSGG